jgi:hypothetical protein
VGVINGGSDAVGESGKDYDKFSLPRGSGFIDDIPKVGARSFMGDSVTSRIGEPPAGLGTARGSHGQAQAPGA